jgi:hypothetical protein
LCEGERRHCEKSQKCEDAGWAHDASR